MNGGRFFSRSHWLAFWATYAIVQVVYILTLAPSVTLEDSGELITAADSLGVPHPPGYPMWTIATWLFIHVFPFGNIAWRANLCSSVFGAFSCAIVALITAYLAARFSDSPATKKNLPADPVAGFLPLAAGMLAGLSLGFLESLWFQSVITEVYSLNAFVFALMLLFMLRWLYEPERLLWGFLTFVVYGIGLTSHQTLLFFAPALLIFVAFVNWRIFRDLLPYVLMCAATMCWSRRTTFVLIMTGILYAIYIGMLIYTCRDKFDVDRIIFILISVILPVGAGFLAAECVNDVSTYSSLTNRVGFRWAVLILIFGVWVQLLLSFFGAWRMIIPYALVMASAVGFAKQDEYAIVIAVALAALFVVEGYFQHRDSFTPARAGLLALAVLLSVLGGFIAAVCVGSEYEFAYSFAIRLPVIETWDAPSLIAASAAVLALVCAALFPLVWILRRRAGELWNGRKALLLILAGMLGLGVYVYMPLASKTNPPMNWSYTSTVSGFVHSVTRGQYDPIKEGRDTTDFFKQIEFYYTNLVSNYTLPIALLAVLALIGVFDCGMVEKKYAVVLLVGWFFLSLALTYIVNTSFEEQTLFINRVFYSTSHMIFSIWVGIGMVVLFSLVNQIRTILSWIIALGFITTLMLLAAGFNSPFLVYPKLLFFIFVFIIVLWCSFRFAWMQYVRYVAVFLLPALLIFNNLHRNDWRAWGSDQAGHDFGWMFGYDMLKDLDRDAIVLGGTDPGRFVPTFMIFVESFAKPENRYYKGRDFDRRDLYIITQNALADSTYMDYIRDHYSETRPTQYNWFEKLLGRDKIYPPKPLKLPDLERYNEIFSAVCEELKTRPDSGITVYKDERGYQRVGAEGVAAIFAINGAIAKEIFEKNKQDHTFYVEESFPLDWMFPHLEPAGLIMKVNKDPIPKIPDEVVRKDMAYWNTYTNRLLGDPKFLDDIAARRAFAKLRSAIGGLYKWRGMKKEAEAALLQAVALYGGSSEASAQLIDLYVRQERFDEARLIALNWLENDPENKSVLDALKNVQIITQMAVNRLPLTVRFQANPADGYVLLELTAILANLQRYDELDGVVGRYLKNQTLDPALLQRMVNLYENFKQMPRLAKLLRSETKSRPNDYQIWYNLAVAESLNNEIESGVKSLRKAIALNENLKSYAAQDDRLAGLRASVDFQKMVQ